MFKPEDKYIIVNYHYVQDPSPKWAGIYPCSIKEFDRQAEFFSKNYQIVSIPAVFEAAKKQQGGNFCAITFDDGLRNHYENAWPVLKKYNTTASFFPITSVFEGRLPSAHKVHILLSRFAVGDMIDLFQQFISEFYPDLQSQYVIPKDRRITDKRVHEDPASANFKETLIALPEDIRGRFLRHCFKVNRLNEKKIAANLFMSKEEIKKLQDGGMTIGAHSHGHYSMALDDEASLRKDIQLSKQILSEILGKAPEIFSYPHGRAGTAAVKALQNEGFKYAVTIERRGVKLDDNPLLIPRYDTMDIKEYLDSVK